MVDGLRDAPEEGRRDGYPVRLDDTSSNREVIRDESDYDYRPSFGQNNSGDEEQKDVHKPKSRLPQMYV